MTISTVRVTIGSFALIVGASFANPAVAGPTWPEGPDAGQFPFSAQVPIGIGSLGLITGSLTGPVPTPADRGLSDFEDMFLINIANPTIFCASTDPIDGGFANFNTELFLFTGPDHPDGPGLGMFANDDNPGAPNNESRITGTVTDASTGPAFIAGLDYFLAISGFDDVPQAVGGNIFNQALPTEISGPDGFGGGNPINNWSNPGEFGDYRISLCGVEFSEIPSPGTAALLGLGMTFGTIRRRR